jgi:hypothetical protein
VHGPGNLIGIQDKKDYAKKKRIFQQGFSDTALRRHEPKVIKEIDVFCDTVLQNKTTREASSGGWAEAKDMNIWCKQIFPPLPFKSGLRSQRGRTSVLTMCHRQLPDH